ncbi:MAG: hypothetical protein ABSH50_09230 [Bryobacteraceae bacterium]
MLFGAPGVTGVLVGLGSQYIGPAIGYAGIDQVNAVANWGTALNWTVPAQGCKVPMYLSNAAWDGVQSASQLVDVSIHSGGGACVDSPQDTLGIIEWQEMTLSDTTGTSTSEAVTARFLQSDGLGFPAPGPPGAPPATFPGVGGPGYTTIPPAPAACAAAVPTLDAGNLMISGPGIASLVLAPVSQDGQVVYQASVPSGAIQGGAYQAAGAGSSQIAPFSASGRIPAPITILGNLQPGANLPGLGYPNSSFTVQWSGGDDQSAVTLEFIVRNFGGELPAPFDMAVSTLASNQSITISDHTLPYGQICNMCFPIDIPNGDVELIFTQTPVTAPTQPFSASGLGMGGELTWRYVFDYKGLTDVPPYGTSAVLK